jgi:hypothetical protein
MRAAVALATAGIGLAGTAAALPGSAAAAGPSVAAAHVARPSGLVIYRRRALEWKPSSATGYQVEQARNAGMTRGVRRYTVHGPTRQFTPYGLTKGTRYYFKIRAVRGSYHSAYTAAVHFVPATLEQPITVMTYNILTTQNEGKHEGGNTVAAWALRQVGVVALIHQANPSLIGIEEGAGYTSPGVRQVDDLVSALGPPWALAHTEIPPSQPHFFRTGVYIIYNSSKYAPVGAGNHIALGANRFAAYQEFRNLTTGARLLYLDTHLLVGSGRADDLAREAETKTLITFGSKLGRRRGIPVVYGGDFNSAPPSDKNFTLDGAGIAAREANLADALTVAQTRIHPTYNSANEYATTPLRSGDDIDHLFTSPGVGVSMAEIEIDLRHGSFPGVIPSDHNPLVASLRFPY